MTIRTRIIISPFREMDLEVREPADLSTGDHQHLVRKAADNSIQPTAKQTKETPPSPGPKQTHGKPPPKADHRADSYVVQISEETTPEESNTEVSPFSETSIRRGESKDMSSLGEKSKCSLKTFPQKY